MAKVKFAAQWKERRETQHTRFQALAAEARSELEMIVRYCLDNVEVAKCGTYL